eukprot:6764243-Pyramimonas_sp.AAC.1
MGRRGGHPTGVPTSQCDWWEGDRPPAGPRDTGEQSIAGNSIQDETLGPMEVCDAVTADRFGGPTYLGTRANRSTIDFISVPIAFREQI